MAYVTRAMKDAYKEASTPDSDGQVAEIAMKDFGKEVQHKYGEDARSGDYNHLLCVSMDMIDCVNQFFEEEGYDLESDEDDDYDDYYDDEEDYVAIQHTWSNSYNNRNDRNCHLFACCRMVDSEKR